MPERRPLPESERPSWGVLLLRGLRKRCARCGGGRVYDSWFRMKERCPTCGLRFEREPGFFVGAYLINFAVAIALLFVVCMAFVAQRAVDADASPWPAMVAGLVVALAAPVVLYPFARTVWSAIDLGMTPVEPAEAADARRALAEADDDSG